MPTKAAYWLLILAPLLTACGEERVVSKYKNVAKPIDTAVNVPDVTFSPGAIAQVAAVVLPKNKRLELSGRVFGVATLHKQASAMVVIRPRGKTKSDRAAVFATVQFDDDDTLRYVAVIEPLSHTEEIDIWLRLNLLEPIIIPGRVH
jgi:hypothetical protein